MLLQNHLYSLVFLCGFPQVIDTFISSQCEQTRQGNFAVCDSWLKWVGWRHWAWGRLLVCASDERHNVFCGRLTAEMSYCLCTDKYLEFIAETFRKKLRSLHFYGGGCEVSHDSLALFETNPINPPPLCMCVWACGVRLLIIIFIMFSGSLVFCVWSLNMNAKLNSDA